MTTLNFDRNSGRVPVVDAESGNILGESFLPMFYRGSFRLAGIAAVQDEKPALLFTPPEIVFINKVCALVKPEAAHEKGEIAEDADFAPMEQVTVFAQGAVPMGRISSISVDQKTGLPAGFTVEPLPAEEALRCAPAPREETGEEAPAEEPQTEPEVPCEELPCICEEKAPEVCAEEPAPCEEAPAEEPQTEPEVPCEEQPRGCEEEAPEVCAEEPAPCGEAPAEEPQTEPEVPCEELPCICEEKAPEVCAEEPAPCGEAPDEEPQAEPEAFEEPSDELPTIEWLLADKGAGVNVPPVTIDMPAEGQPALEKALTAEPAENADPMAYEAYYEDTTPEQFLRKLEGLLGPAAFDKSVIPEPPQMINSELFEPDVIGEMPRTEELPAEEPAQTEPEEAAAAQPEETPAGEPKAAPRRTLDMAELLAEKYEAQEAAETAAKAGEAKPEATEPEAQAEEPAAEPETSEPEEPVQAEPEEAPAAQPEDAPAEEPADEPETSEPEEPAQAEPEEAPAAKAEPEEAPAAQPEDAPAEEPAAEPETSEPEEPAQAEPEEAPAAQPEVTPAEEPAPAAPPASGSEVNFRNTASYRPEEFNLNAPEDYYRPNINYKKELQKMNGSQILGMLLFAGACVLAALV